MNQNPLRLLYWNANSIRMKIPEFKTFLVQNNIDGALLNETHLKHFNDYLLNVPGYQLYHTERATGAKGGTAILIKSHIQHMQVTTPNLKNLECTSIKIWRGNREIVLTAAYNSPTPAKKMQPGDLNALLNTQLATIIAGDLNAKSPLWNSRLTNRNGQILKTAYETRNDFCILGPDTPTIFPHNTNQLPDVLDIVLHKNCNFNITVQVMEIFDSDHCPVLLEVHVSDPREKRPNIFDYNVDWNLFRMITSDLTTSIPDDATPLELDETVERFTAELQYCLRTSTTRTRRKSDFPPELKQLIQEKNRMRKLYNSRRDPRYKILFNEMSRLVKNELQKHQEESITKELGIVQQERNPNIWLHTKKIMKIPDTNPPLKDPQGDLKYKSADKVKIIHDHMNKKFTPPRHPNQDFVQDVEISVATFLGESIPEPLKEVDQEEMANIVRFLPKKAPGFDKIPALALKHLHANALEKLRQLYNACLRVTYLPRMWKTAKVITFTKPGKPPNEPSSLRPISLLPIMGKTFERIILNRLLDEVDEKKILRDHQFGCRQNLSAAHQLTILSETIASGFNANLITGLATIDVTAAFDKIWHGGLLQKLINYGISASMIRLINSFLTSRSFYSSKGGANSQCANLNSSLPQGSLLSPLLFILYTNDSPDVHDDAQLSSYVDDTAAAAQAATAEEVSAKLNRALNALHQWLQKWRLEVNASKSQVIFFHPNRQITPPPVYINGEIIPRVTELTHLGVTYDSRLNFEKHIENKLKTAKQRLGMLRPTLQRLRNAGNLKTATLVYTSLIRPIIDYASPAWGSVNPRITQKIQIFQNQALRAITNAPWFVRNSILHRDLKIEYIPAHLKTLATNFYENCTNSEHRVARQIGTYDTQRFYRYRMPKAVIA